MEKLPQVPVPWFTNPTTLHSVNIVPECGRHTGNCLDFLFSLFSSNNSTSTLIPVSMSIAMSILISFCVLSVDWMTPTFTFVECGNGSGALQKHKSKFTDKSILLDKEALNSSKMMFFCYQEPFFI